MAVRVQHEDFDICAEIARLIAGRTDIGAVVTFTGIVRDDGGGTLASLTLEHYPGMTEAELARVEAEAEARWPLQASLIVHRVGTLRPGDNIVLVVTASAHREAAFDAAAFLMDYLKTRAPFWKKEQGTDGSERWVEARECDDTAAARWGDAQLPAEGEEDLTQESLRRFYVELFIVHPTLDPAEISLALGLEAQTVDRVGDRRRTPKGKLLEGNYRDTRWRHSVRHDIRSQGFADQVAGLVERLTPHKAFLRDLEATGGRATVIVDFLDGYFSDCVSAETLAKLADLRLELGIVAYDASQTPGDKP
jgi:molybdopterin synthase catalytic subunit